MSQIPQYGKPATVTDPSDPRNADLTDEAVYASVEGQTHDAWTRKVHLNSENNGKLEGSTAVPNASTRAPDGMAEKPHVSLADKIKGQYKIALGGMKHDVNLAQEGEDLKNGDKDRLH